MGILLQLQYQKNVHSLVYQAAHTPYQLTQIQRKLLQNIE